jgi:hypothetical protein
MTDESQESGLHIDSDWKQEAAREKERLAEQERRDGEAAGSAPEPGAPPGAGPANFVELVNALALQAIVVLGGMQGPGGERIPANPPAAKHYIDLLEVLRQKTEGNLTDEEERLLSGVLHELRMQYVQVVGVPPPPTENEGA